MKKTLIDFENRIGKSDLDNSVAVIESDTLDDKAKNTYRVELTAQQDLIKLSSTDHKDYKSAMNEFLQDVRELTPLTMKRLISNGYTHMEAENSLNTLSSKQEITIKISESAPEFLKDELITNHGFSADFDNPQKIANIKINSQKIKDNTISNDHIVNAPKSNYVIAGLKYAGMHYEGYSIKKELLTTDPNEAVNKFIELNEKGIAYKLYKTTSNPNEFKIDSFGDPANELSVLLAGKDKNIYNDIKSNKVITIYATDNFITSEKFIESAKRNEVEIFYRNAIDSIEKYAENITVKKAKEVFTNEGFTLHSSTDDTFIKMLGYDKSIKKELEVVSTREKETKNLEIKKIDLMNKSTEIENRKPSQVISFFKPSKALKYEETLNAYENEIKNVKREIKDFKQKPIFEKLKSERFMTHASQNMTR